MSSTQQPEQITRRIDPSQWEINNCATRVGDRRSKFRKRTARNVQDSRRTESWGLKECGWAESRQLKAKYSRSYKGDGECWSNEKKESRGSDREEVENRSDLLSIYWYSTARDVT